MNAGPNGEGVAAEVPLVEQVPLSEESETGRRTPLRLVLIVTGMVLLTMAAIALPFVLTMGDESTTYSYVIPPGTGDLMDRGADVVIIPARLDVHVGDVISIVNNDDRPHSVGPFYVPAGEQLEHRFNEVGTIAEICTIHPSGRVTINVT